MIIFGIILFVIGVSATTALHHWTLDTSNGLIDDVGDWDLTAVNAPTTGNAGLFGESYGFTSGSSQYLYNNSVSGISGNWSFCGWSNLTSTGDRELAILNDASASDLYFNMDLIPVDFGASSKMRGRFSDGATWLQVDSSGALDRSGNNWYHNCLLWNGKIGRAHV